MIKPDWQTEDGSIRLYRGDCLEVMPLLTETVDAIICDPPFGTTACKWDTVIPFAPFWEAYRRLVKANGTIVLFGTQPFTSALVMSNPKMFRQALVWDKVNKYTDFLNAKNRPMRRHEDVLIFADGQTTYNPQYENCEPYKSRRTATMAAEFVGTRNKIDVGREITRRNPCTVIAIPAASTVKSFHPTQKPVQLLEYLTRTYTNPGETVLDSCFGSGTAAIACLNTGRRFIGVERDAHYFDVAVSRIEAALGNVGLFADPLTSITAAPVAGAAVVASAVPAA